MDSPRLRVCRHVEQVVDGVAFENRRCRDLGGDVVRNGNELGRRDVALLGIGADRPGVADPVAGLEEVDALPDLGHGAGAFTARRQRQGQRVQADAVIDVEKVEPDGIVTDARFAGPGRRQFPDPRSSGPRDRRIDGQGLLCSLGVAPLFTPRLGVDVETLDENREGHGRIDVALGHMHSEPVGHQRHADHQKERQGQHLCGRMARDEAGNRVRGEIHQRHGDDDGGDHDFEMLGHADGGDDRVDGKNHVEQNDLHDHRTEGARGVLPGLFLVGRFFDGVMDLDGRLVDKKGAAGHQDDVRARKCHGQIPSAPAPSAR